ncbi:hypothetical protein XBO1_2420005 [Xenorhabdus bovienii str. oregonense]|uniref:Uncharacterized protein n=1 Tax=Xenorhabdus bovienii str. oregonense TaxID=1398202 RepID=A0A077PAN4_XENBV|nr:hypothetical protein [Xenorhabdus bovienii]CDH06751.1 hypothetical protein XBO1_2420005 [Xenorhabdus bovienii str. oregonense]
MFKQRDYQVTPPGGQRPEHVQSAFTIDFNHELLSVTSRNWPLTDFLFDL